jgi:general secretion pathway protein C
MQDLIKRYFWVIGAVVVAVCAVFAAKATGAIIEAKWLGDPVDKPKVDRPTTAPSPQPIKTMRSKDGTQLSQRNMFCSDCTPAVVTPVSTDPSTIVTTSLPLVLLATNVAPFAKDSYATIINTESQRQGAYSIGEKLPGGSPGTIKAIRFKYVDFENNGRTERVVLQGATVPVTVAAVEPTPAPTGDGDELQAAVDSGIKKIDDTTYEIDKSLVEKVLLNPMAIAKGARVVPAMKNGKPEGFKLYAIKPSSAFAKLGLTNGDTLTQINGFELTSADKALEVYTKLREASNLELEVTRRGKPVVLKYTIR